MRIKWRDLGLAFTSKTSAVWLLGFGFIISWFVGYLFAFLTVPYLSTQVRYAGVSLETLGFVLVAIGIRETRKLFERPSLMANLAEWSRFVVNAFRSQQHSSMASVTGRLNLTLPALEWKGTGTVRESTLQDRVEILERGLQSLRDVVRENLQRQDNRLTEIDSAVRDEKSERVSAIANASYKVEQLAVGGLQYEIVGLIWVVVGTLASNLPDEVAKLISFVW